MEISVSSLIILFTFDTIIEFTYLLVSNIKYSASSPLFATDLRPWYCV